MIIFTHYRIFLCVKFKPLFIFNILKMQMDYMSFGFNWGGIFIGLFAFLRTKIWYLSRAV